MVAPEHPSPSSPANSTILIVDDDRVNIHILRGILKPDGFRIEAAESGEELLERYPKVMPDLVLLDVMLPGIDGFATCRELRRRYGAETAPVIFITAKAESEDVVEGLSAGGVDYLPKPFRPKEALARIHTHLQIRRLMEQLTRANAAKNRFLGMCAHDLRSPLASIRGLAEFLQDANMGTLSDDQRDLAATIQSTAQSMLQLVNELLDFATIEAGELRIARQPCDLPALIEKAVKTANMDAARKETQVEFLNGTATRQIEIDSQKIRQVLDNLLSNAVKYSPPGSRIQVILEQDERMQRISVVDQGPGIPDEERHQLFKDFGRLSTQPTGGEKSTGLGLAICRKIIAAHDGTITADNLPEGGCAFRVTLPNPA
ncbi:MAG TPA: hybrid sensor histidine kinase/response regulator [Candidatus Synoicihabitans sp.]|nr:hybrid sensor histidine kinase/response regulator [Candidatus Synoicihabitans sp.]